MEAATEELTPLIGTAKACLATGVSRPTIYRRRRPAPPPRKPARGPGPRALSDAERAAVMGELTSERFVDCSPGQVVATLLDEGRYLASERTMYRVLAAHDASAERRLMRSHPTYAKPELIATAPNEVWSWDITKLRGPAKWNHYSLYVVLDIFSRYVVGWTVQERELGTVAAALLERCAREQEAGSGLIVHADNGGPMKSKPLAYLLADLGITKSHSRPHTSNDNPFSEAQFKTLKYCPRFPGTFASIFEARSFCREFFAHYNDAHCHSGIGMMTPSDVHHGRAEAVFTQRAEVLEAAYAAHPERFVGAHPLPRAIPTEVWINKPARSTSTEEQEVIAA